MLTRIKLQIVVLIIRRLSYFIIVIFVLCRTGSSSSKSTKSTKEQPIQVEVDATGSK